MNATVQGTARVRAHVAPRLQPTHQTAAKQTARRGVVLADAAAQKAVQAQSNQGEKTLRAALHRNDAAGVSTRMTPVIRLTAPAQVTSGNTATLRWSTENATSCEASGDWSGDKALSGSETTGPLTEASEYRLTCRGDGGAAISKVEVGIIQPIPEIDFSAEETAVVPGTNAKLNWLAVNAENCRAGQDWSGDKPVSGSEDVGPINDNSIFSLTCANADGFEVTDVLQVTINVAALSWTPPTHNVDGSEYTNPGGYRIYWGTQTRDYMNFADIADPTVTEFTIELPPDLYFFAATAYNTEDQESDYSNEASKAVGMPTNTLKGEEK